MNYALSLLSLLVIWTSGCAMFTAWKSIPPPGGCDQCHTVPISANWQLTYQAAAVADERGRLAFQTPEQNLPAGGRSESPLASRKVEEKVCFDCHKAPTPAHRERKGRFHH
ncbi:MAG TPA: cytochrome C [Desulfuromonadales bacterium]|nr:cytochrome C [Desulfuromonadales bacterium]